MPPRRRSLANRLLKPGTIWRGMSTITITIRAARVEDAGPIARLDVETRQATYAGILATPYLAGLSAKRRELGWRQSIQRGSGGVRVAVDEAGGIVIGFGKAAGGAAASRNSPARCSPSTSRRTGRTRGSAAGFCWRCSPGWSIRAAARRSSVLRENPARFFYQRLGGKEVRRKLLPCWRQAHGPGSARAMAGADLNAEFLATIARVEPRRG